MKKIIALLLATIICLSFVACNSGEKTADESTTTPTEEVKLGPVEITSENFDTYFEFVEESFFTGNASGEKNALRYRHYYKLRDKYNIDITKSSIKLDYGYSYSTKKVDIDFKNEKFTLGEQVGEKTVVKSYTIDKISQQTYKEYAIFLLQPTHASKGAKEMMYFSDFTLNSVEGSLYLVEPRIEHVHTN